LGSRQGFDAPTDAIVVEVVVVVLAAGSPSAATAEVGVTSERTTKDVVK
jgi:hypothetical protein